MHIPHCPKDCGHRKLCIFRVKGFPASQLVQQQRWKDTQLYGRMCWMYSFLVEARRSLHCLLQDHKWTDKKSLSIWGTGGFLESFRWTCGKRRGLSSQICRCLLESILEKGHRDSSWAVAIVLLTFTLHCIALHCIGGPRRLLDNIVAIAQSTVVYP